MPFQSLLIALILMPSLVIAADDDLMTFVDDVQEDEHTVIIDDSNTSNKSPLPDIHLPLPPKEADIEYVIKLVERKKWQRRTYQALERKTVCLYTYHDVVFRVWEDTTCHIFLPQRDSEGSSSIREIDITNQTSKYSYPCSPRTVLENARAGVQMVNSSEFLRILSQDPETDEEGAAKQHCVVVLFYSKFCPFSMKMAPDFNAFGRAFLGVDIMAVDVSDTSGFSTRYGIVAVPDILLFHRSKPVLRFNFTERTYYNFVAFLQNNTGLEADPDIQVSAEDLEGPLSSTLVQHPDYLLWFSNTFVIFFAIYILKQRLGDSILQRVREYLDYARQVWRTGELYEQVGVHDNEDEFG